jgi:hypothetical protein
MTNRKSGGDVVRAIREAMELPKHCVVRGAKVNLDKDSVATLEVELIVTTELFEAINAALKK